jgi:hypothetical protein
MIYIYNLNINIYIYDIVMIWLQYSHSMVTYFNGQDTGFFSGIKPNMNEDIMDVFHRNATNFHVKLLSLHLVSLVLGVI